MTSENRARPIQVIFRVNEYERGVIAQRMAHAKTKNMSDFCRKMTMNGMIINVDYKQIKDLFTLIGRLSGNVNQIAKRLNTTGRIYDNDIAEIKNNQAIINGLIREINRKLI